MKILICSKLFYPSNRIGAVRPTNFAKYLTAFGHDVTVFTEKNSYDEDFNMLGVKIIRVSNSAMVQKLIAKNTKRVTTKKVKTKSTKVQVSKKKFLNTSIKSRIKQSFIKNRRQLFSLLIEFNWYRVARRAVLKQYQVNSFDVVISSFGPLSSFLLGKSAAKLHIAKYWISDFRDNMIFDGYPGWLNKISHNLETVAVNRAHALTFISKGQKTMFLNNNFINKKQKRKIHVVYNGYEKEISEVRFAKKEDKILTFSYTGQLYSGFRDFTLLFHVVNDLIEEKQIDFKKVKIIYAGQNSNELILQINKFKYIKNICTDYGFVSREKALRIQEKSDILIALTWNTHKEQGILTGKFLEYLQANKPIIALTSGNLPYGELTQMVQDLHLGIACEYVNYQEDYLKLKNYIVKQYNLILSGKSLNFSPKTEEIRKFHYDAIIRSFNKQILTELY